MTMTIDTVNGQREVQASDCSRAIHARQATLPPLPQPVAEFPAVRIMRGKNGHQAVQDGIYRAARTTKPLASGRLTAPPEIDGDTFYRLCAGDVDLTEWRDNDIINAAVEFCRANNVQTRELSFVTGALTLVLAYQHGAGDFNLLHTGAALIPKER